MNRILTGKRPTFHQSQSRGRSYRVLLWIGLILGFSWLMLELQRGNVESPFMPTPTPTRSAHSYILQAETFFTAGKLDDPVSNNDAIDAYKQALMVDPDNAEVLSRLARIETYSTRMLSNRSEQVRRLQEALEHIDRAVELAPDDSTIRAYRAFVLDWNAAHAKDDQRQSLLNEAEGEARLALHLDPDNPLVLAFYAEVLLDQQKWSQAEQYARQAVALAPDSMDTHRVLAIVLESLGAYRDAISEYQQAVEITPNLTFLDLQIGIIYRHLAASSNNRQLARQLYEEALTFFARAAGVNKQLGIDHPAPYIAIAKTYAQQGEFFIASRNIERALSYDPANADTYAQLGMIYVQSRNYEGALPAFQCALRGCSAEENDAALNLVQQGLLEQSVAVTSTLNLTDSVEVAWNYVRYGSVLLALSSPAGQECPLVMDLMSQVRENYSFDPFLLDNVEKNEDNCTQDQGSISP